MTIALTSAAGFLALLDDPEDKLKEFALNKINEVVDEFWAEISDEIVKIEVLYEDEGFNQRQLAALIASKVYYHLGEYEDSLNFALGAGEKFDVSSKSEFVETIISKCIDKYINLRVLQYEGNLMEPIDPRLEAISKRMFTRCFEDSEFKQAIGIALESRDLEMLNEALVRSGNLQEMLAYTLDVCMTLVLHKQFRGQVLSILVEFFSSLPEPDYESMCRCLVFLNDHDRVAQILCNLIEKDDDLVLFQLGFDLYENATQYFLQKVQSNLPGSPKTQQTPKVADSMEVDQTTEVKSETVKVELEPHIAEKVKKLISILSGETSIGLNLEFLVRNNHTDLVLLQNTKSSVDARSSVYLTATLFSNAIMHAGTSIDNFLRVNIEWLAKATNWTKFSAIASLGMIHKGHLKHGLTLLSPYLPQQGVSGSPYSEGGALFALGLIHANHGRDALPYILKALKETSSEIVQHGACLGLGVAAMATDNEETFDELKSILFTDSAVGSEAAGISMGLVMLGTCSTKAVEEMLQYAQETQHEKIIRGLAIGISLIMYGAEEEADVLIERLCQDKDPILRYGGMYTIAMAYAGTANNKAIRKLLHVAVSDVSDDVRRASVIALGFLLFKTPEQCPRIVELLAESYNPHVRYGATIALGIACAGTGLAEAVNMLEPLTSERVDFVRQGAMLALSMILIQHNDQMAPKSSRIRKNFDKIIGEKHEGPLTKFGAILAQGIVNAGGRNVTISLKSRSGNNRTSSIVGLMLFLQYWYWYPLVNMLSLSFTPTTVIGLNKDLNMPKVEFLSNTRPSSFAYVQNTPPPTNEKVEKVATAILSTTNKAKARAQKVEKEKEKEKKDHMEGVETISHETKVEEVPSQHVEQPEGTDNLEKPKEKVQKKEREPRFEYLENPARVLPAQLKYLSIKPDSRYTAVKKRDLFGILMLRDLNPNEEEVLVVTTMKTEAVKTEVEEDEPAPPEPFEYPFDD